VVEGGREWIETPIERDYLGFPAGGIRILPKF